LLFCCPREKITAKKNAIARGRFSVIRASSPVSIRKGNQLSGGAGSNEETTRNGVLQISENSLDSSPMNITWCMRELGHFVYSEGYIWTSDGEIMQGTNCASVEVESAMVVPSNLLREDTADIGDEIGLAKCM
jgi:hypothetical protein